MCAELLGRVVDRVGLSDVRIRLAVRVRLALADDQVVLDGALELDASFVRNACVRERTVRVKQLQPVEEEVVALRAKCWAGEAGRVRAGAPRGSDLVSFSITSRSVRLVAKSLSE